MAAIALSLAAAVSWGAADFLAGLATRRAQVLVIAVAVQVTGALLVGLLVAATGLAWDPGALMIAIAGGVMTVLGVVGLYAGLALGPMTVVATISAAGVAVPVLYGLLGGEQLNPAQVAGMVLAGLGVLMTAQDRPLREELRSATKRAVGFALLAAVGLGGSFVALEQAAERTDALSAVLLVRLTAVLLLSVAVIATGQEFGSLRKRPTMVGVVGVLDAGGVMLFTLATTKGLLGIAALVASLYPVVTVSLAMGILGERIRRFQAAGVVTVFAGVILLGVGSA